jgi:hypothetical protein
MRRNSTPASGPPNTHPKCDPTDCYWSHGSFLKNSDDDRFFDALPPTAPHSRMNFAMTIAFPQLENMVNPQLRCDRPSIPSSAVRIIYNPTNRAIRIAK